MDSAERYKKEQDLMFQETEEREALQRQAIQGERAETLLTKRKVAGVRVQVILDLFDAKKSYDEIIAFLDKTIIDNAAKALVTMKATQGKPITFEEARKMVLAGLEK